MVHTVQYPVSSPKFGDSHCSSTGLCGHLCPIRGRFKKKFQNFLYFDLGLFYMTIYKLILRFIVIKRFDSRGWLSNVCITSNVTSIVKGNNKNH